MKNFYLFILCVFCACSSPDADLPEGDRLGNQVIFSFGEKVKTKGLKLVGFGGAEDKENLGMTRQLSASFKINSELTVPIARKLIVEVTDEFLRMINADEKLRQYLSPYPFTAKNVDVAIFGINPNNRDDRLLYVSLYDTFVAYRKDNPKGGRLIAVFDEDYDEAVRRLQIEEDIVSYSASDKTDLLAR